MTPGKHLASKTGTVLVAMVVAFSVWGGAALATHSDSDVVHLCLQPNGKVKVVDNTDDCMDPSTVVDVSSADAVDALQRRVTTLEGDLTTLEGDLTTLEGDLTDLATKGQVTDLANSLETQINNLDTRVTADLDSLGSRVTGLEDLLQGVFRGPSGTTLFIPLRVTVESINSKGSIASYDGNITARGGRLLAGDVYVYGDVHANGDVSADGDVHADYDGDSFGEFKVGQPTPE